VFSYKVWVEQEQRSTRDLCHRWNRSNVQLEVQELEVQQGQRSARVMVEQEQRSAEITVEENIPFNKSGSDTRIPKDPIRNFKTSTDEL
jgi:hypothetical protein